MKIILIITLIIVFIQDLKERQVYWFLFPIVALCSGILLYKNVLLDIFYTTIGINLAFVFILLLVVFLYSKFKLKTPIKDTFGIGDGLLFIALAFTFTSVSFLVLFVFGLVFSLVLHLLVKKNAIHKTVPLAGYLSLFFAISYLSHWLGILETVYTI